MAASAERCVEQPAHHEVADDSGQLAQHQERPSSVLAQRSQCREAEPIVAILGVPALLMGMVVTPATIG
jgi:hypothetical protein